MTKSKVIMTVPPKVHLLDLNGPAHIFYEACEYGAEIDLHYVSVLDTPNTRSAAGLSFTDLTFFRDFKLTARDLVFVPGIYFPLLSDSKFLMECNPFFQWLRDQYKAGTSICSICTGSFLLAEAGILNGKSCTTHWKRFSSFTTRYPHLVLKRNRLFVVDSNIYTSAGISSGIDLALFLLEERFGKKLAADVAKEAVVYFRRSPEDPQLSVFLSHRDHLEDRIHRAQEYILKHISIPFIIPDIADEVNMSERNLTRLFKKTTGITIRNYVEKLRAERARQLLNQHHKMEYVAAACGLKTTARLRALLHRNQ